MKFLANEIVYALEKLDIRYSKYLVELAKKHYLDTIEIVFVRLMKFSKTKFRRFIELVDVDIVLSSGNNFLGTLVFVGGPIEKIDELVKFGINKSFVNNHHMNALEIAVSEGKTEHVEALLKAGFMLNSGIRPILFRACSPRCNVETVKLLIERGARVEKHLNGDRKINLLSCAVQSGNIELVKYFLTLGFDVNPKRCKMSPLMYAVLFGHLEIAEFLVANGADKNYINRNGQSVLELAESSSRNDILEFLKRE